jgi:hypothetical protein
MASSDTRLYIMGMVISAPFTPPKFKPKSLQDIQRAKGVPFSLPYIFNILKIF